MQSPLKKISVTLIAILIATLFPTPAQAAYDIAIARSAFGAGVASNVGITLSGFDENQSYQATVKFVDTATNLDATNGTLAANAEGTTIIDGYSSYSATKLGFKGTYAQVAAALASVTWNPLGASGNISIRIGIAPYEGPGKFYDANSGHYYEYVSTGASWTDARSAAEAKSLYGMRGYLAEINTAAENNFIANETSAEDIWIGATEDATTTANYRGGSYSGLPGEQWIWQGAEITPLPTGTGLLAQSPFAAFSNWSNGEPNNDVGGGADCAVTNWGVAGFWNDLPCAQTNGYLIEFGGRSGETFTAAARTFTQTVVAKEAVILGDLQSNVSCTFGVDCSFPLSVTNPTAKDATNVDVPGTFTYTSSNSASTSVTAVSGGANVVLLGAGSSTITATFTPSNTTLYAGNFTSFTITVGATVPAAPTGLSATAANGSVAISWTAGSNGGSAITDYLIEYSTDESTWSTFADGTSASTSETVSGLTNGTLYFFRVSTINSLGMSPASSVASTTPVAPPTPIPTPSPNPTPAPTQTVQTSNPQPAQQIEIGTAQNPALLVERLIEELSEALKPVIVDIFSSPPAGAPVFAAQSALNLITSTTNKVVGNSPSLVLFGGQYQPSRVLILDDTIAQVVSPNGGVMNLEAKNGESPIAVDDSGRVQMLRSNMVVAQGNGLAPNTEFAVYMFSQPTLLGIGRTNDKGEFFVSFAAEKKIPLGDHTLQVNGLLPDGRTSSVSMPVSIVDSVVAVESEEAQFVESPAPETSYLPYLVFALIGSVLFVLGLWWFLAALRRRKKDGE